MFPGQVAAEFYFAVAMLKGKSVPRPEAREGAVVEAKGHKPKSVPPSLS